MDKKLKLFVLSQSSLKECFSGDDFKSLFEFDFYSSSENMIEQITNGNCPSAIIIDEKNAQDFSLLEKINEATTIHVALKSDLFTSVPVAVILEVPNQETEIKLLENGFTDVFDKNINKKILFYRIKNLIKKLAEEAKKFNALNAQQKNAIQQLIQLSSKTGIYNKQTFIYKAKEFIDKKPGKIFTFMRFDLDRFKVFNDIFGFSEGDKILEKIGEKFHFSYKKTELVYGHIYADHFIVCFEKFDYDPDKIVNTITTFVNTLHPSFDFIVRIGFYEVVNNGNVDVSLACDHAQLALQSIKTDFVERYAFYKPEMINDLKQEQELISDMVTGLHNNEFQIWLQPQYDYTTQSLTGAEALVRWLHPTKGLISPGVFIPIFERNGFITQLDQYVWEKTCQLLKLWQDDGLNPVPVSVNISRRDIYTPNLVKIFDNLIEKYNLTPNLLRLEITESAYMDNPNQLIKVVQELRDHGFCLEMDDFGSGYSSLNTLKDVPVDILKLDMKFIMSATEDLKDGKLKEEGSRCGSILSSVVRMANWLKLPVIAEGIESKEQADYLKSIGCFNMQGFYFSKPIPAGEYQELISTLESSSSKAELYNIQSALNFFDTSTQDSLLFNDFIGASAILEWSGTNVEILRVNDAFLDELGTTRDSFKKAQKNIIESLDSNSRIICMSTLAEATKTSKSLFCELLCTPIYIGTQPFWIRAKIKHLSKTATSDIFYCSIENINFRMQLLQLNTNISEQLANIMESVPCGIFTINYDGKTISTAYINETTAKICGYNQSEFRVKMSENPLFIFPEHDSEEFKHILWNCVKRKVPAYSFKTNVLCKNGETKIVQLSGNLAEQSNGNIYICSIMVDINDIEKNNLSKYTSFVFSAFNEVYELDFTENTSRTVKSNFLIDYKKSVRNLDTVIDSWINNTVVEDDRKKFMEFISQNNILNAEKNKIIPSLDYRIKTSDGNIERLRTLIIKSDNNKYLCCSSNVTHLEN